MSLVVKPPTTFPIAVTLGPALARISAYPSGDSLVFEAELERAFAELREDLQLPGEITLTVAQQDRQSRGAESSYHVSIAGRPCRMARMRAGPLPDGPRALAHAVVKTVIDNRELFATTALSAWARARAVNDWKRDDLSRFSEEDFRFVIANLFHRCLSLDCLAKKFAPLAKKSTAPGDSSAQWSDLSAAAEHIAADVELFTLKVITKNTASMPRSPADDKSPDELLKMMDDGLYWALGLMLPKIETSYDEYLGEHEFRFQINDLRFPPEPCISDKEFLVNETPDRLEKHQGISGRRAYNPASGYEQTIAENVGENLQRCHAARLTVWGSYGYLVLSVAAAICKHAGAFVSLEWVEYATEKLEAAFPDLVRCAKRLDRLLVTGVLRRLVERGVSIQDLRGIYESLVAIHATADFGPVSLIGFLPDTGTLCPTRGGKKVEDLSVFEYENCARIGLRRAISHKHTGGQGTLIAYTLDQPVEKRLSETAARPLEDSEREQLLDAIEAEIEAAPATARPSVILTSFSARRTMQDLIELEFPQLAVLASQELSPDLNVQTIGRISLPA